MFALLQKTIAACQNCFPRFYLLIITEQRIVSRVRESRHTSDTFVASSSSSSLIEASFKQTRLLLASRAETKVVLLSRLIVLCARACTRSFRCLKSRGDPRQRVTQVEFCWLASLQPRKLPVRRRLSNSTWPLVVQANGEREVSWQMPVEVDCCCCWRC